MDLTDRAKIKLERTIQSFSESYMNNSKWKKVFIELVQQKEIVKKCIIHDFFYSGINELDWSIINTESTRFITQKYINSAITTSEYPVTYYKGIEYIEFPKLLTQKSDLNLMKEVERLQNTDKIKERLSKIGMFTWEENNEYLRLIGYRNNKH